MMKDLWDLLMGEGVPFCELTARSFESIITEDYYRLGGAPTVDFSDKLAVVYEAAFEKKTLGYQTFLERAKSGEEYVLIAWNVENNKGSFIVMNEQGVEYKVNFDKADQPEMYEELCKADEDTIRVPETIVVVDDYVDNHRYAYVTYTKATWL